MRESPSLPSDATAAPLHSDVPPSPWIDPGLGAQPDPAYPESQAIGIGTIRITAPRSEVAQFWLTCEWPTTLGVAWLYTGDGSPDEPGGVIILFGESVTPAVWVVIDSPQSFGLSREGEVANYRIDPATPISITHTPDWSSGSLAFEHLRLDPESWPPGPLPTPKESYERPLGGDATALDLAGSFDWTCGPRPRTVPSPGPIGTYGPGPEIELPFAKLTAAGEVRRGILGCGMGWGTGGQVSAGTSCGSAGVPVPPFALSLPKVLVVSPGQDLVFSLPSGYHFEAWRFAYVDLATAELYRGAEPTGVIDARDGSTTAQTVTVEPPPRGEWMVRLTFDATNGDIVVHDRPDYFRVDVQ